MSATFFLSFASSLPARVVAIYLFEPSWQFTLGPDAAFPLGAAAAVAVEVALLLTGTTRDLLFDLLAGGFTGLGPLRLRLISCKGSRSCQDRKSKHILFSRALDLLAEYHDQVLPVVLQVAAALKVLSSRKDSVGQSQIIVASKYLKPTRCPWRSWDSCISPFIHLLHKRI